MSELQEIEKVKALSTKPGQHRNWLHWTPYAAVAWSLAYAALGVYWIAGGHGFPYAASGVIGPLIGQFGTSVAWVAVLMAGIPAAVLGVAMLRGVRSKALHSCFIIAGALLSGVLLLLMTDINLLILFGYIPYTVYGLITGIESGQIYLKALTQWATIHQLICLIGGFLWLAATVAYARRSGGACLYCGRRDGSDGWESPNKAARWGRIAVYVSLVTPVFYAVTRYVWALGFPLGISEEAFRSGQEDGLWISGLFLATFGLVGAAITFGLVKRWGEVFPRWMIGLAGRRVPIALAVIPASFISVLLVVGGISMWSGLTRAIEAVKAGGAEGTRVFVEIFFLIGPLLMFPVWGAALAVATLGYYFRRRGQCRVCGRGTLDAKP